MMFKTHAAFSILAGLIIVELFGIENQAIFIVLLLFFGLFPDIDEKGSVISKMTKFAFLPVGYLFRHRGFFHSAYIPMILFVPSFMISPSAGIAILAGYLSHAFLDSLTKAGIRPLFPLSDFKLRGCFKTGLIFDYSLFFCFAGLIFYLAIF